jgi:hypothetical protein
LVLVQARKLIRIVVALLALCSVLGAAGARLELATSALFFEPKPDQARLLRDDVAPGTRELARPIEARIVKPAARPAARGEPGDPRPWLARLNQTTRTDARAIASLVLPAPDDRAAAPLPPGRARSLLMVFHI